MSDKEKLIKFIEELAWLDAQHDAFMATVGIPASRLSVPQYAKKYLDLWKKMFNEDLVKEAK